jgi:hypothetical protein
VIILLKVLFVKWVAGNPGDSGTFSAAPASCRLGSAGCRHHRGVTGIPPIGGRTSCPPGLGRTECGACQGRSDRAAEWLAGQTAELLNTSCELEVWCGRRRLLHPAMIVMRVITHHFHHRGQLQTMLRLLAYPVQGKDFPGHAIRRNARIAVD